MTDWEKMLRIRKKAEAGDDEAVARVAGELPSDPNPPCPHCHEETVPRILHVCDLESVAQPGAGGRHDWKFLADSTAKCSACGLHVPAASAPFHLHNCAPKQESPILEPMMTCEEPAAPAEQVGAEQSRHKVLSTLLMDYERGKFGIAELTYQAYEAGEQAAAARTKGLQAERDKWKHRAHLFRDAYRDASTEVTGKTIQLLDLESLGPEAMRIQRDRARDAAKKMIAGATANLKAKAEAAEARNVELMGELESAKRTIDKEQEIATEQLNRAEAAESQLAEAQKALEARLERVLADVKEINGYAIGSGGFGERLLKVTGHTIGMIIRLERELGEARAALTPSVITESTISKPEEEK